MPEKMKKWFDRFQKLIVPSIRLSAKFLFHQKLVCGDTDDSFVQDDIEAIMDEDDPFIEVVSETARKREQRQINDAFDEEEIMIAMENENRVGLYKNKQGLDTVCYFVIV